MKIGIDFGSTYSAVSKYDEILNHVTAITFSEGEPASIPSVVSVSKKGQITCGKGAKDQAGKKTVRIFEAFKMLLTETNQEMLRRRGYDEEYTPRRITKLFLESVLDGVLRRENDKGFEDLVICVPEIWSSKVATLDGRLILRDILINDIDIPVEHVQIVTEPEAASAFFAYNYEKQTGRNFNGHLLLIDYGGGTLDITLTKVTSDQQGIMEIRYVDGGGAGENHPDQSGGGTIGSAGIAYMQSVVTHALQDAGVVGQGESPDYTAPDFIAAVRDLESQLKSAERIRDIEDTFGAYGSYRKISRIFREEAIDFITLEYDEEEVPVTFQHLFLAYQETIEQVLSEEIRKINEKVQKCIGKDPCEPETGIQDDFKIALVGGFGSFFLVKQQVAEIYRLDANANIDLRTKNITAEKREQAISLGAALLAAGKVVLQKTARYSIGLFTRSSDGRPEKFYYAIKYHQMIKSGHPYFILEDEEKADEPGNRTTWGALYGNIDSFVIGFDESVNRGAPMRLRPVMLERLKQLPQLGFWNCGFSMDENEVVSFHVVPSQRFGLQAADKGIEIPLESYSEMFDLTAISEVTI